jgi:steroid delta-isomerase-like uncharacterized protein
MVAAAASLAEVIMPEMNSFVQRLVDAYNHRRLDDFDALLTDDVVLVRDEAEAHGREEFKSVLTRLQSAFPDIEYHVEDTIVAGDKIVLRWSARGTHRGEYLGVSATNREASYTGITIYELRGDRVARIWVSADLLSLLRRLRRGPEKETPRQPTGHSMRP